MENVIRSLAKYNNFLFANRTKSATLFINHVSPSLRLTFELVLPRSDFESETFFGKKRFVLFKALRIERCSFTLAFVALRPGFYITQERSGQLEQAPI